MFTKKFGEKLAEGLATKWAAQKLGPALVFWAGGGCFLALHWEWQSIEKWLVSINKTPIYIALAMGGLLLVVVSGTAAEWLQTTVIRWSEGYWPWPFKKLRFSLAKRLKKRLTQKEERWEQLDKIPEADRSTEDKAELVHLDALLNRYPLDDYLYMPTTLGNLLRSAEEYPKARYGLDAVVCWPRMWLLMPDETLEALTEAREELNASARLMLWSIVFTIWTIWSNWAALSVILVPVAYLRMLNAAESYGDLIRSAFDIHRFKLYEALKWPLPTSPAQEAAWGEKLTEYLFRGTAPDNIGYAEKDPSTDEQ